MSGSMAELERESSALFVFQILAGGLKDSFLSAANEWLACLSLFALISKWI